MGNSHCSRPKTTPSTVKIRTGKMLNQEPWLLSTQAIAPKAISSRTAIRTTQRTQGRRLGLVPCPCESLECCTCSCCAMLYIFRYCTYCRIFIDYSMIYGLLQLLLGHYVHSTTIAHHFG